MRSRANPELFPAALPAGDGEGEVPEFLYIVVVDLLVGFAAMLVFGSMLVFGLLSGGRCQVP